ncbi:MAG: glycosyltransferase [Pseudomonadota bacterium]
MPVELMSVDAIGDWRSRCDMAFCVVEEVWHRTIDQYEPLIKSLSKFDLIVCCFAETCERLAEVTGKPVIHVPYGVDALRFLPDRGEFDRPIDIHYMGRRRPELHDALLAHARDTGRFYHYDTFTSLPVTTDHNAHRDHLANLVRRSKLFMVDYAKKGHADQKTGEMMGWGPRHIEGMMGGAVQVGYTPDTADYLENFDWPTVVSRLPEDADEAVKVISDLLSDPAKLTEMRLQNYAHVGRRHDWLQRWRQITEFFGLPDTPAMAEREAKIDATTARLTRRASDQVVSIGSIGGAKR